MGSAVVKLSERRAQSTDEAFADLVPLDNGGIAITTEIEGVDCLWEFDRAQTEILIRALTLAFVTRKSVRIVQPLRSAA